MGMSPQIINLQTELNYLNWFKTYCIFSDLGVGVGGWMEVWVGGGIEWKELVFFSKFFFCSNSFANLIKRDGKMSQKCP